MSHDMPDKDTDNDQQENEWTMSAVELLTHPAYEELMRKLNEAEQKANQYWERILAHAG